MKEDNLPPRSKQELKPEPELSSAIRARNFLSFGSTKAANLATVWMAAVTTIVGVTALLQISESGRKRVDDRVVNALKYIERYSTNPELRNFRNVMRQTVDNAGDRSRSQDLPITDELISLVGYFDAVHTCVEAKVCDPTLSEEFFHPHARGLWLQWSTQIMSIRETERKLGYENSIEFGEGLQALARE